MASEADFTNLTLLCSPQNPTVDVVAVENLGERPLQSWTYQKDGEIVVWLQDPEFLPHEIPSARVFSFGYSITDESDCRSLAQSLLEKLNKMRLAGQVLHLMFSA